MAQAKNTPLFDAVIAKIDNVYTLRKPGAWFKVGSYTNPEGHTANGSLKIIAYACIEVLSIWDTLNLFEEYYEDVLRGDKKHPNISALVDLGDKYGYDKTLPHFFVQFENDRNPLVKK